MKNKKTKQIKRRKQNNKNKKKQKKRKIKIGVIPKNLFTQKIRHVTRQVGVDVLVTMFMLARLELRARDSDGGLEVAPRSVYGNVRSMYVLPGEWGIF
jgi:hypothetical protein